jgi:uncharacterized protein YkwD
MKGWRGRKLGEMSSGSLHCLVLVAILSCPATALAQRADLAGTAKLIVEATNELRREEGVGAVRPNAALAKAAQYFADFMARTDRYGHEADGRNPADRARSHGYDYCLVAENIAYLYRSAGFRTAELAGGIVEGWKHSPEHRKNMLEAAATDTAVAVARSDRSGRYYAVQMFGRPKSERIEFRITNAAPQTVRYHLADQEYSLGPRETRIHWLCGPDDLTLHAAAGASARSTQVRPNRGDRLVVVSDPSGVSIRRER